MARNRFAASLAIAFVLGLVMYEYAVAHHILPGASDEEVAATETTDE